MTRRWAILLGANHLGAILLAALLASIAATAQAQAPAAPYRYDTSDGPRRAPLDKSAGMIARETAAAAEAEARCEAGDQAGCADLGRAYLFGEGKPQSRPVAEILMREACLAGAGAGCFELGTFFATSSNDDWRGDGAGLLRRGCDLGTQDACASLADLIQTGITPDQKPDPGAAATLRRQACAAGSWAACAAEVAGSLDEGQPPETREAGIAVLGRLCGGEGYAPACAQLVEYASRASNRPDGANVRPARSLLDTGCRAGVAEACTRLGLIVYAEGEGPPEARNEALALFDRACDLETTECRSVRAIRARPALAQSCQSGDPAACAALGDLYSDSASPFADWSEALRLMGTACEAGEIEACGKAAGMLGGGSRRLAQDDADRVMRWSLKACDMGDAQQCEILGERLVRGDVLPPDRRRGLELASLACEGGRRIACETLEAAAQEDPEAPLPTASSRLRPPMSEEEEAAYNAAQSEERRIELERDRAKACTTTAVAFRGTTYTDTICDSVQRIRRGFPARAGEAPWQALVWRPQRLGDYSLTRAERVQCGGALISTGWILTAAHCLEDELVKGEFFPIATSGHRIRLGVANPLADEGVSFPITRVIPHRLYNRKGLAFDIALIQYDPKAGRRGAVVRPIERIRLDTAPASQRRILTRMPAYTYGWGSTAYEGGGEPPDTLRGARLELRDQETCRSITGLEGVWRDSVLCAMGARGEQACFGDSGGALIDYGRPNDAPMVIGVVSAGVKCGTTRVPSRFTRLGHEEVRAFLAQHLPGYRSGQAGR